jgi:inorganic pyrophosphatase
MVDEGEIDWKLISIRTDDPLNDEIKTTEDLINKFGYQITGIREWFRWYKTPDNKPLNGYIENERLLNADETIKIIDKTNKDWENLVTGKADAGKLWIPGK